MEYYLRNPSVWLHNTADGMDGSELSIQVCCENINSNTADYMSLILSISGLLTEKPICGALDKFIVNQMISINANKLLEHMGQIPKQERSTSP